MKTVIISNGSKWAGQEPDPLAALEERLATKALNPLFEHYGDFITRPDAEFCSHYGVPGGTLFFGNFLHLSAAFSVLTSDAETVSRLTALVIENKQRADYIAASPDALAACNCETCRPDPEANMWRRKERAA